MNHTGQRIVAELKSNARADKAQWWNRYMKGEISFLGVGLPKIRKLLLELNRKEKLEELAMNQQVGIVNGLMKSDLAEEKLAAILYMQLFWLGKQKNSLLMGMIADWFDDRYIFDWNTTDWLCVKVLTPLVETGDTTVIAILKKWNRDPYLWKARASLVPFALASNLGIYRTLIRRFSDVLIRREERFAKTAVGWVLREYSKHDTEFVLMFLSKHVKYTTSEVKRNALKYYRQSLRSA